jgi:hypothetical protein
MALFSQLALQQTQAVAMTWVAANGVAAFNARFMDQLCVSFLARATVT